MPFTQLRWLRLAPGDVLMLHTDGATEAANARRERLGLDAVIDAVAGARGRPLEAMRDAALERVRAWATAQEDDVTLMLVRYLGDAAVGRASTG